MREVGQAQSSSCSAGRHMETHQHTAVAVMLNLLKRHMKTPGVNIMLW